MVVHLLDNGADPAVANSFGWTPLHAACRGGDKQVVTKLLDAGANAEVKDQHGKTPSDVAIESGHSSVAEVLNMKALAALASLVSLVWCNVGRVDRHPSTGRVPRDIGVQIGAAGWCTR